MIDARLLTGALDLRFHPDGSVSVYDQTGGFRFRIDQGYNIKFTEFLG